MLLNGNPLNYVPYNQPELAPLGIFINDNQPVNMTVSGIGYLTTAIIPIKDIQPVKTSTTFLLVAPYQFTAGNEVGQGVTQDTTLSYGWQMPIPDPLYGVGILQNPSNRIGQRLEMGNETGVGITQEAIVRISFHEQAGFSDYAVGRLQSSLIHLGFRSTSGQTFGNGLIQPTYTSVGTDIISFTGSGRITTSVGPTFTIFYSGIRITPDPGVIKVSTIEDAPKVVLGTVAPKALWARTHTSTAFSASPVLSTVRPRLKPSHTITKADAQIIIFKRPEPLIVTPKAAHMTIMRAEGVVRQATLKLHPEQSDSVSTSAAGEVLFTTAIIQPAPGVTRTKALRGTEFQEVVVDTPNTRPISTGTNVEIKWAPYVIECEAIINTTAAFDMQVGPVVIDLGVVPIITKARNPKVVLSTVVASDLVSLETQVRGLGSQGSMTFEYDAQTDTSVHHDPVFLSTAVLKPEPGITHMTAGEPKIQMPPLVLDNEFQASVQTDSEGDVILGTILTSFISGKVKTTAEGQFKRGTASPYSGGPVVDTDDRHTLNVEPLNKPGLRSLNIQN